MKRVVWAIAVSLFCAGPLAAQKTPSAVALEPGDAVTIRTDASGAMMVSQRGTAEWTPFDIAAARHLSGLPTPDGPVPYASPIPHDEAGPAVPEIEPDRVRLKFLSIAGRHSLLVVQNGYDQAIAYRARMTRDGRTTPTDVCLVIPRRHGFEHWPHPIERLEIYDMRVIAWHEGDLSPCA